MTRCFNAMLHNLLTEYFNSKIEEHRKKCNLSVFLKNYGFELHDDVVTLPEKLVETLSKGKTEVYVSPIHPCSVSIPGYDELGSKIYSIGATRFCTKKLVASPLSILKLFRPKRCFVVAGYPFTAETRAYPMQIKTNNRKSVYLNNLPVTDLYIWEKYRVMMEYNINIAIPDRKNFVLLISGKLQDNNQLELLRADIVYKHETGSTCMTLINDERVKTSEVIVTNKGLNILTGYKSAKGTELEIVSEDDLALLNDFNVVKLAKNRTQQILNSFLNSVQEDTQANYNSWYEHLKDSNIIEPLIALSQGIKELKVKYEHMISTEDNNTMPASNFVIYPTIVNDSRYSVYLEVKKDSPNNNKKHAVLHIDIPYFGRHEFDINTSFDFNTLNIQYKTFSCIYKPIDCSIHITSLINRKDVTEKLHIYNLNSLEDASVIYAIEKENSNSFKLVMKYTLYSQNGKEKLKELKIRGSELECVKELATLMTLSSNSLKEPSAEPEDELLL